MSRKQKKPEKKNKKDSKKERKKNQPERLVETEQCGSLKDEDVEKRRNFSEEKKGKHKSSGKKSKEKNSFKLMTDDILIETKPNLENTNNSNTRKYVDLKNPLKSEIMNTFVDKTTAEMVEESSGSSADEDEDERTTKETLLQKHFKIFSELMKVQPKRHTEAQIQMENRRAHASKLHQQNQELEKRRKSSVESMLKEDPVKKRQEYLKKQQEKERKRNQEEMNELRQSGAEKKAKAVDKRKITQTSASENIPKKTWGSVPSKLHISQSDPVIWPTLKPVHQGNIWSERDRKQKQLETLMPKTSEEEEEMIKQALELSKKTAEEESQYQKIYEFEDELTASFLVNRMSMESQQLSEWIGSTTKVDRPDHRNRKEKSRLPHCSIDSATNWDNMYQLEPKSSISTNNPREKVQASGKQQRMLKPRFAGEGRGKLMEACESWVSEETALDHKLQEVTCINSLESHQELMESERRTGFSSMDSKFEASKRSHLVDCVDSEYYDPNGGARPKYSNIGKTFGHPKCWEKENKMLMNKDIKKSTRSLCENTPTVYKKSNEINKSNLSICEATLNKWQGFSSHSVDNVENSEDHLKENTDNDFPCDSAEDWNRDIDYVGPECDPDLKTSHLTYSGFHPEKLPKPQIITASSSKINEAAKEEDHTFYEHERISKSPKREQHCAFAPPAEEEFAGNPKEPELGRCNTFYSSSEDEFDNESNGEQVKETPWNSTNITHVNEKPGTEMNEVQSVASTIESSLNVSVPVSRGVCFKSARTKFSESKSLYLSSRKQHSYSSVCNTTASTRSGNDNKRSCPAYPKSLSKDLTGDDQSASVANLACNITQSRIKALQHCSRLHQSNNEKQIVDTVSSSCESPLKSQPVIPNLPKSCTSSRSCSDQAANDQEIPANFQIPLGLPPHLVNAYLLYLQEQEEKGNNTSKSDLDSTQIEIERNNKYSNAKNLNPEDSLYRNRPQEIRLLGEDSKKKIDFANPHQESFSDKIPTSHVDSIAQSDNISSVNSSEQTEDKNLNNITSIAGTSEAVNVYPCTSNSSTMASKELDTPILHSLPEENTTNPRTLASSSCGPKASNTCILTSANTERHNTLAAGPKQIAIMGLLNNMNPGHVPWRGKLDSNHGMTCVGYPSATNSGMIASSGTESTLTTNSRCLPGNLGQTQSSHVGPTGTRPGNFGLTQFSNVGLTGTRPPLPNVMPYYLNNYTNPVNILENTPHAKNLPIPSHYPAYSNNPYEMTLGNGTAKNLPVFMLSTHQAQNKAQKIPETMNISAAKDSVVSENSAKTTDSQTKSALTSKERQRLKQEKLQKVKLLIEEVRKEQSLNSCMKIEKKV